MRGNLGSEPFYQPRRWLDALINDWLLDDSLPSVAVIEGPPGSGKSRFLHAVWREVEAGRAAAGMRPGAAILRDRNSDRPADQFSWAVLRRQLLGLLPPALQVHAMTGGRITVSGVEAGRDFTAVAGDVHVAGIEPMADMREVVIPLLGELEAGPPLLLVIDALDEGALLSGDLLPVFEMLARYVAEAGRSDRGLGRVRVLLASQPEVPLDLGPWNGLFTVDLSAPDETDVDDMTAFVDQLLANLPVPVPVGVGRRIAERARGVWLWATFVGRDIAGEAASGRTVPNVDDYSPSDGRWLSDALDKVLARHPDLQEPLVRLLVLLAASQEADTAVPRSIQDLVLGRGAVSEVLKAAHSILAGDAVAKEATFFHQDFGRFIIGSDLLGPKVDEMHAELVLSLEPLDRTHPARPYADGYLASHAVLAAEAFVTQPDRGTHAETALRVLGDAQLAQLIGADMWSGLLARLTSLLPVDARFYGSQVLVHGFLARLQAVLEFPVGLRIASRMTEEQIDEFEAAMDARDHEAALQFLEDNFPDYRAVVAESLGSVIASLPVAGADAFTLALLAQQYEAGLDDHARSLTDLASDLDGLFRRLALLKSTVPGIEFPPMTLPHLTAGLERILYPKDDQEPSQTDLEAVVGGYERHWEVVLWLGGLDSDHARCWALLGDAHTLAALRGAGSASASLEKAVEALGRSIAVHEGHDGAERRALRTARLAVARAAFEAGWWGAADRLIEADLDPAARTRALDALGDLLRRRHRITGDADDLAGAVRAYEAALACAETGSPVAGSALIKAANLMLRMLGNGHLDRVGTERLLEMQRQIVGLPDLTREQRAQSFGLRGDVLVTRWEDSADPADLDAAVAAYDEAIRLAPPDSEIRLVALGDLSLALGERAELPGAAEPDFDRWVDTARQWCDCLDSGDDRAWRAHLDLGRALRRRARIGESPDGERPAVSTARVVDLDAAIEAFDSATRAADQVDAEDRSEVLVELADALIDRTRTDDASSAVFDRAVRVQRELCEFQDRPEDARARSLVVLGQLLVRRWQRHGDPRSASDLDEAIEVLDRALDVTGARAERERALRELAAVLRIRLKVADPDPATVERAFAVHRECVGLVDANGEGRSSALGLLGRVLLDGFEVSGGTDAARVDEAVATFAQAVEAAREGAGSRVAATIDLANALALRCRLPDPSDDLFERAIAQGEAVCQLPDRSDEQASQAQTLLGDLLSLRWSRSDGDVPFPPQAIRAYERAAELADEGTTRQAAAVFDLAMASTSAVVADDPDPAPLELALAATEAAASHPAATREQRIRALDAHGDVLVLKSGVPGDSDASTVLGDAIAYYERAFELAEGTSLERMLLIDLANAYLYRLRAGPAGRPLVDRGIEVQTMVCGLEDRPDSSRSRAFACLGEMYTIRDQRGFAVHVAADLVQAVIAFDKALQLGDPDDSGRAAIVVGRADALIALSKAVGHRDRDLADRVVEAQQEVCSLDGRSSEARARAEHLLGDALVLRWQHAADPEVLADLEAAAAAYERGMGLASGGTQLHTELVIELTLTVWKLAVAGRWERLDRAMELAASLAGNPEAARRLPGPLRPPRINRLA